MVMVIFLLYPPGASEPPPPASTSCFLSLFILIFQPTYLNVSVPPAALEFYSMFLRKFRNLEQAKKRLYSYRVSSSHKSHWFLLLEAEAEKKKGKIKGTSRVELSRKG